jgi:hypothetical protein
MLMGAGSYALYHARAKMSIGAAKNFFLFFLYIYLCKLYHTFALLSIHFKIKKEKEDTTWYPLSFRKFALHQG